MNGKFLFRRRLMLVDVITTVQKLVNKSTLSLTSTTSGDTTHNTYTLSNNLTKSINKISDLKETFFDYNEDTFNKLSLDYSTGFISEEYANELLEVINTTENVQTLLDYIELKNFGTLFENKDLVINKSTSSNYNSNYLNYDSSPDFLSGSTFNSVTLNINVGNVSVLQNMFRRAKVKTITFNLNGGRCAPSDMSGFNEFNTICTSVPNTIDYRDCVYINYAFEQNFLLQEIPSYYTVTNEASRISTPANIIGGNSKSGIIEAEQAFNQCRTLRKIGPVLDLRGVVPDSTGQPKSMFNDSTNVTDVRFKNLCNGDWNFSLHNSWLGIPNMDLASIKYCIENLAKQTDLSFTPLEVKTITEPTYDWNSLVSDSTKSLMFKTTNSSKFINIPNTYKVLLPEGLTMKLVWWVSNQENQYNQAYNVFTTIVGDGTEKTFTNSLTDYQYATIEVLKTDGSDLNNDTLYQIVSNTNIKFYVGSSTTNLFISPQHKIYFGDKYKTQIEAKDVITSKIIQTANNKGWSIYIGNTLLTP